MKALLFWGLPITALLGVFLIVSAGLKQARGNNFHLSERSVTRPDLAQASGLESSLHEKQAPAVESESNQTISKNSSSLKLIFLYDNLFRMLSRGIQKKKYKYLRRIQLE